MNSIPQLFFFVKYLALAEQTPIAFCADFPQGDDGVLVLLRVAGNLEPQNDLCRKIRQLNLLEHQRRVRAVPAQDIVRLLQGLWDVCGQTLIVAGVAVLNVENLLLPDRSRRHGKAPGRSCI